MEATTQSTQVERILLVSSNPDDEYSILRWCLDALQGTEYPELHIMTVLPEMDFSIKRWLSQQPQNPQLEEWVLEESSLRERWQPIAQEAGVELFIHVCFGKLFYDVIQYAQQHEVDLVIRPIKEDRSNPQALLFDSHSMHLLRKCPIPLFLYKVGTDLPFESVMASVDVSLEELGEADSHMDLNQKIFQWAQWLQPEEPIHITHAWQEGVEFYAKHWSTNLSENEFNELSEMTFQQHQKALNQSIKPFKFNQKPVVHYLNGEAVDSIRLATKSLQADVLVMGTLTNPGLAGFLIGSTAEQVMESIDCSVLALKPQGFVSPIPELEKKPSRRRQVATD